MGMALKAQFPIGCPVCTTEVAGTLKVDSMFLLPFRNDTLLNPGRSGAIVFAYGNAWLYTNRWTLLTGISWGTIPGTMTAQHDLDSALNSKQTLLSNGYGWFIQNGAGVFDSAHVRKVDTVYAQNDSTIKFAINGVVDSFKIRGSASGSIVSSITLNAPSAVFNTPATFSNTAGAWTVTLSLATQSPNTSFMGPATAYGTPGFRLLTVGDLPTGIPNSNLQNSIHGLNFTTNTTPFGFTATSVALGNTIVLNIPYASGTNTNGGLISYTDWNRFNASTVQLVTGVNGQTGNVVTLNADSLGSYPINFSGVHNGYVLSIDTVHNQLVFTLAGSGSGITQINGLAATTQFLAIGTAGTSPNWGEAGSTHTLNIPYASSSDSGIITPGLYNIWNAKESPITSANAVNKYWNGYKLFSTLNTDSIAEGTTNKYFHASDTVGFAAKATQTQLADTSAVLRNRYDSAVARKVDTSQRFGIHIAKGGGRGINLLWGHDSTLVIKGLIDSGGAHLILNPDSTLTVFVDSTHWGGGGGGGDDSALMATMYRLDTVKANLYARLGAAVDSLDSIQSPARAIHFVNIDTVSGADTLAYTSVDGKNVHFKPVKVYSSDGSVTVNDQTTQHAIVFDLTEGNDSTSISTAGSGIPLFYRSGSGPDDSLIFKNLSGFLQNPDSSIGLDTLGTYATKRWADSLAGTRGVPGGPTNAIQTNNGAGGFAGSSNLLWDNTNFSIHGVFNAYFGVNVLGTNQNVFALKSASGAAGFRMGRSLLGGNLNDWFLYNDSLMKTSFNVTSTNKLVLPDSMQITSGSPGTGKVLTSDASGNASWQSAGSTSSGSFTSTLSNTTNIASSSFTDGHYTINNGIVHVIITGTLNTTVALTSSVLTVSLPITASTSVSNFIGMGVKQIGGSTTNVSGAVQLASSTTATWSFVGPTVNNTSGFVITVDYAQ